MDSRRRVPDRNLSTRNPKPETRNPSSGFTLIEVLVAISLLAVIVAIIYESLAAVTDATAEARLGAEQLRLRQFLARNLHANLSGVHVDPAYLDAQFQLVGVSESGSAEAMDSLDFCSSAPLMGGMAPPGSFKKVHYRAVSQNDSSMELGAFTSGGADDLAPSTLVLESSEALVVSTSSLKQDSLNSLDSTSAKEIEDMAAQMGYETPTWSVPISGLDFSYYDGEEWVEDWDSLEMGRMPWCVRVRINFAQTREQAEMSQPDLENDPDLDMYIPISIGMGVFSDASVWQQYVLPPAYWPNPEQQGTQDQNAQSRMRDEG